MASETSSSMIMFIAAVVIAALAAGVMTRVVSSLANGLDERGDGLTQAFGSSVALVNDPQEVPYDAPTDELLLYVKNTGSTWLIEEELTVFVNGQHEAFVGTLLEGATSWSPGTVLECAVTIVLPGGDHRAHVSYTPDLADDVQFRV